MGCRHSNPVPTITTSRSVVSVRPSISLPPSPNQISPRTASHGSIGSIVSQLITPANKLILTKTWRHIENRQLEVGMRVFHVIFTRTPGIKQLFPFADVIGDALANDPRYRAHALHFMTVIGAALENVDDLEGQLGRRLLLLGAQHSRTPGFSLDYFEEFTRGLGEVWAEVLGEEWTRETRAAWEKLFLYLMMELRAGYLMAVEGERVETDLQMDEREGTSNISTERQHSRRSNHLTMIPPNVVISPPLSSPGAT